LINNTSEFYLLILSRSFQLDLSENISWERDNLYLVVLLEDILSRQKKGDKVIIYSQEVYTVDKDHSEEWSFHITYSLH